MSADATGLTVRDDATLADLTTYLARARTVDPDGAVRLVGVGSSLAAYVSPVHGSGGPTVVGLRVLALAEPSDVDTTVPLAAMGDRLARLSATAGSLIVPLPPMQARDAGWAGLTPPRSGWQSLGVVDPAVLQAAARDGARAIADGAPEGSGAHAVARLRGLVWGREVAGVDGLVSGAAFAGDVLGFVTQDEPVAMYACGSWRRLTTQRGHVLARRSLL